MSATATCATPIKGSVYRLVQLDSCGNPVTGTGGMQVVAKGFVQCAMAPQYDAGVEFFSRTADGSLCVNQMDDPILKRMQLTIDFCEINQTGISYATTMTEIASGSPATGTGFSMGEGLKNNRWSLEIWQQVAGVNACDPVTGLQRYVYNAWPNVGAGQVGAYTIANAVAQFQVIAQTRAISTNAVKGWYAKNGSATWLPGTFAPNIGDHWYWNVTTTAPPAPACNPLAAL
jgi:hypothetical protein